MEEKIMTIKLKSGREISLTLEEYFEVYGFIMKNMPVFGPFTGTRGIDKKIRVNHWKRR